MIIKCHSFKESLSYKFGKDEENQIISVDLNEVLELAHVSLFF